MQTVELEQELQLAEQLYTLERINFPFKSEVAPPIVIVHVSYPIYLSVPLQLEI